MNVSIAPWKRFGYDRLYVSVDNRKLGYRDMNTSKDHPDDPADAALLTAVVDAHLRSEVEATVTASVPAPSFDSGSTGAIESVAARSKVAPEPAPAVDINEDHAWTDLAGVRPGQLARERAEDEWEARKAAHPFRSRLGRLLNVHTDERAWRIGADGEEAVGAQLEKLATKDPRWNVLHSVSLGERGSDIDHVVIGPAGVFTINTKHHPGASIWVGSDQLRVNGHIEPYIRNSRFEAKRTSQMLSAAIAFEVPVAALIIMWGVDEITIKTEPGEKDGSTVHIAYRRQAARWLAKQRARLTEEQVETIYQAARRSTTWSPLS